MQTKRAKLSSGGTGKHRSAVYAGSYNRKRTGACLGISKNRIIVHLVSTWRVEDSTWHLQVLWRKGGDFKNFRRRYGSLSIYPPLKIVRFWVFSDISNQIYFRSMRGLPHRNDFPKVSMIWSVLVRFWHYFILLTIGDNLKENSLYKSLIIVFTKMEESIQVKLSVNGNWDDSEQWHCPPERIHIVPQKLSKKKKTSKWVDFECE